MQCGCLIYTYLILLSILSENCIIFTFPFFPESEDCNHLLRIEEAEIKVLYRWNILFLSFWIVG